MTDPSDTEHATIVAGNNARQGVTGNGVRYVLAFGVGGAIIAFVALALAYAAP